MKEPAMHPKPPEAFRTPRMQFLCEQKGPTEALFTAKIAEKFAAIDIVRRAYLVRATYEHTPGSISVVLAISARIDRETAKPALVSTVATSFADLFGVQEHLDIMFLSEAREEEIKQVCSPFYVAG